MSDSGLTSSGTRQGCVLAQPFSTVQRTGSWSDLDYADHVVLAGKPETLKAALN